MECSAERNLNTETERSRREDGHDVSCPYAGMIFCYDYA
jgi:hypothetical protein